MVRSKTMRTVGVAEAKAKLSELLEEVANGEAVEITRRGKPIAKLVTVERERQPIDIERLKRHLARFTSPPQDTEQSIREWKDNERY
jgi:prevent-host-death family protein